MTKMGYEINENGKYEHRFIMEDLLGRKLNANETVHHRNGDKQDNSISNLFLFPSRKTHTLYHWWKRKNPNLMMSEEEWLSLYKMLNGGE